MNIPAKWLFWTFIYGVFTKSTTVLTHSHIVAWGHLGPKKKLKPKDGMRMERMANGMLGISKRLRNEAYMSSWDCQSLGQMAVSLEVFMQRQMEPLCPLMARWLEGWFLLGKPAILGYSTHCSAVHRTPNHPILWIFVDSPPADQTASWAFPNTSVPIYTTLRTPIAPHEAGVLEGFNLHAHQVRHASFCNAIMGDHLRPSDHGLWPHQLCLNSLDCALMVPSYLKQQSSSQACWAMMGQDLKVCVW